MHNYFIRVVILGCFPALLSCTEQEMAASSDNRGSSLANIGQQGDHKDTSRKKDDSDSKDNESAAAMGEQAIPPTGALGSYLRCQTTQRPEAGNLQATVGCVAKRAPAGDTVDLSTIAQQWQWQANGGLTDPSVSVTVEEAPADGNWQVLYRVSGATLGSIEGYLETAEYKLVLIYDGGEKYVISSRDMVAMRPDRCFRVTRPSTTNESNYTSTLRVDAGTLKASGGFDLFMDVSQPNLAGLRLTLSSSQRRVVLISPGQFANVDAISGLLGADSLLAQDVFEPFSGDPLTGDWTLEVEITNIQGSTAALEVVAWYPTDPGAGFSCLSAP
jgi:hypothetical protein